jgi:NifU-like protein
MSETKPQNEHFLNPANIGDAGEPSFSGCSASLRCGASVRVSLQIDEEQKISEAKFKAAGCSSLVASLSMLTQAAIGKSTADVAVLLHQPSGVIDELRSIPSSRLECVGLACEAFLQAIRKFSDAVREDWLGSESLICTCFCISEQAIMEEIRTRQLATVAEITRTCGAGGGCGSCHQLLQDMIDSSLEEF